MRTLACEHRGKLFREVSEDISLVVSSDTANKTYLSGYASLAHDLAPSYRSAVLASREQASLVVSAADAGPALEFLEAPDRIHRYGTFYFAMAEPGPAAFERDARGTFEEAFVEALDAQPPKSGLIGVDRVNDDLLWDLCRDLAGEERVVDVTSSIMSARSTKTPGELARLTQASRLIENGFRWVIENARAGMTELELAAEITRSVVVEGGVTRFVSVTSGPRSALADAYPTGRRILEGDLIRVDAGCTVDGYWSDIARSFIIGEPSARQRKTYDALAAGLSEQLATIRSGIPANRLFEVAVRAVRSNGIPHYRRQHCGHGIGLRSYDSPLVNAADTTILREGMCLCLETPYYELGTDGMMVEDMVRVTAAGYEPITTISRELFVL